jgi:hypothetical protein
MTRVRTNEGQVTEVDPDFVQQCQMLKMVTEMTDCSDFFASVEEVPVPNIDAPTMNVILHFFQTENIPVFQDPRELFPLYDAANYLGYDKLQNAIAKSIAENLKGRSAQEIRDVFGLEETD